MFFIWGFGKNRNYTSELVKDVCGNCGTKQNMNILTEYNYGSLFFIPILKTNRKYYVVCPHCGAGKQISKNEFKTIKASNRNGLIYEQKEITIKSESKLSIETSAKTETKSVNSAEIPAEIDSIVKKLQERNYIITPDKLGRFKPILKEQVMKKFNNEQEVDAVIDEYFKDIK